MLFVVTLSFSLVVVGFSIFCRLAPQMKFISMDFIYDIIYRINMMISAHFYYKSFRLYIRNYLTYRVLFVK